MSTITPVRHKGAMGPPATPQTPTTSGSTSRTMILTPSSGRSRERSETPFQVKSEPMDPPSPSPKRPREPSALPGMSPSSQDLVIYRPNRTLSSTTPSLTNALMCLSDVPQTPTRRHRVPSESVAPSMRSSSTRAPSSARSFSRFSSLAPSDAGSRIAYRASTSDFDRRTRQRRAPDAERETSSLPNPSALNVPPPSSIVDSAAAVIDVISGFYVEDVDADEDTSAKDKEGFTQDCMDMILEQMFDDATMPDKISRELAEEEIICTSRSIDLFLGVISRGGVADILKAQMKDFVVDGSKSKSKTARQAAWYAKYKAGLPGLARSIFIDKTSALTIVSILSQHWTADLQTLQVNLAKKSVHVKKTHCRTIVENIRKLSEVVLGDIRNEK